MPPTLDLSFGPQTNPLPAFDISQAIPVLFLAVFAVWAVFSLVLAYHWVRYGHQSWLMVPALLTHVAVSGLIILFIMSGLR